MRLFFYVIVCISIGFTKINSIYADDTDQAISILDAGVEQWRSDLVFRCNYTYRQGTVELMEDGLKGNFGSKIGKPEKEDQIRGVFYKKGNRIRISVDYGKPPIDASPDKNGKKYTQYAFDEIADDQIHLEYIPKAGEIGDTLSIWQIPNKYKGQMGTGPDMRVVFTPFEFGGGIDGSPIRKILDRNNPGEDVTKFVSKIDNEHVVVNVQCENKMNGRKFITKYFFWTSASPPVIQRIEDIQDDPKTKFHLETIIVGDDFVKCGKGMMARRLHAVSGPYKPINNPNPVLIAKEWISQNLGNEPPTDNDFTISIPPTVEIIGLKNPPPRGTKREISFANITIADLITGKLVPPDRITNAKKSTSNGSRWILVASTLILLIIVAYFVWRYNRLLIRKR